MQKIFFKSKDGLKLCGVWHIPDKPTAKVIVLAHGITVDKDEDGIFVELAELLKENGYAVFRFDFRGHGESEGMPVDMTITGEIKDIKAAIKHVKQRDYLQVGLLGACFGGGTATLYTSQNQEQLKCLCLSNPCLNYDHIFINPTLPWILKRKSHMEKELEEKGWTTIGSRKYKVGIRLWNEMKKLYPYKELKKIGIPTIIIHGDKDTYVPYNDSKDYMPYLNKGTLITVKNAEHGFQDVKEHRERAKQETLKFFLKYL